MTRQRLLIAACAGSLETRLERGLCVNLNPDFAHRLRYQRGRGGWPDGWSPVSGERIMSEIGAMEKTPQQLREEIWKLERKVAEMHSDDDIVCYVIWTACGVAMILGSLLTYSPF